MVLTSRILRMDPALKLLISTTGGLLLLLTVYLGFALSSSPLMPPPTPRPAAPGTYAFPDNFTWGTATASYQIEGAATTHREPSIWDTYSDGAGNTLNGDTGAEACDHYHRYESDVSDLIAPLGTQSYRFSIAWPRLRSAENRADGVRFYNALIDRLVAAGVTPVATLYHWDLPEDLVGLLASSDERDVTKLVDEFKQFARTCFDAFGDRVKTWITLNEPFCSAFVAYEIGEHAPGKGTLGVDAYRAGHNLLLMHAATVSMYREDFQAVQRGVIGITLNSQWFQPERPDDAACVSAAQKALDFEIGWFAHPVFHESGDYPASMRAAAGDRLPSFTAEQRAALTGSADFFGLNHYTTAMVRGEYTPRENDGVSYDSDRAIKSDAATQWPVSDMKWPIVPWGLTKLLQYVQKTYKPRGGILITENGVAIDEAAKTAPDDRVDFYRRYIKAAHDAMHATPTGIDDGMGLEDVKADVRAYFLWSLMDNFEWALGYTKRFGLYHVDYSTQKRTPKKAVQWYTDVVANNSVTIL